MKCKKCGSDEIGYTDSNDMPDGQPFSYSFYCIKCGEYLDEAEDIDWEEINLKNL